MGSAKEQNYGSVTSLDISKNGSCLISGYEHGEIVLWDISSGMILKNVFGVHESAVVNIKFYKPGKNHVISCDCRGKVFLLQINRVLFSYTVDKKLLFDKNVGPMLSLQIYNHPNHGNKQKTINKSPIDDINFPSGRF